MQDSNDLKYQAWGETLFEMLCDRNYSLSGVSHQDIVNTLKTSEDKSYLCKDQYGNFICIAYISENETNGNVGKNDILNILDTLMKPNNCQRCLLVLDNVKLTAAAKNDIMAYFPSYIFESFESTNLQFNITKSNLVPKHEILSNEETEKFLKKFNIAKSEMPKILYDDPVARYLGMLPGQICKITRISENGGKLKFHRLCTLFS